MSTQIATIQQAITLQPIRELQEAEVFKPMVVNIGRLFALKGQQAETEDLKFMGRELMQSVKERYPGLTVQEIAIALDKGVKGDYGDYYGLNVITFLDWIKAYSISEARRRALEEKAKAEIPEKVPPTPAEVEAMRRESALNHFRDHKKNKRLTCWIVFKSHTYDYLYEKGVLRPTNAEKLKAMERAKEIVAREIKSDRTGGKRVSESITNLIEQYIAKECTNESQRVIVRAKVICLEQFFDELIKNNQDLEPIL